MANCSPEKDYLYSIVTGLLCAESWQTLSPYPVFPSFRRHSVPKLWPIAGLRFRGLHARLLRKPGNGGPYFAMILINAIGYGLFAPFSIL